VKAESHTKQQVQTECFKMGWFSAVGSGSIRTAPGGQCRQVTRCKRLLYPPTHRASCRVTTSNRPSLVGRTGSKQQISKRLPQSPLGLHKSWCQRAAKNLLNQIHKRPDQSNKSQGGCLVTSASPTFPKLHPGPNKS